MSFRNSYAEIMCRVHQVNGKWEMPPMFYARLARTGQREAFNAEVERLKNEGMAHPQRWAEAAAMFPPKDAVVQGGTAEEYDSGDDGEDDAPTPSDDKHFTNVVAEDVRWAWTNLRAKGAVGAPSQGAIHLREYARSGPRGMEVLSGMVMKFVPPVKQQTDETVKMQDTGASVLELMDRIEEAIG